MQTRFSDFEYTSKRRQTRRDRFLTEIEAMASSGELVAATEPHYPKGGGRGCPPIGPELMLSRYIAQNCSGLCDEGIGHSIYDSQAIRHFVGIGLGREMAPEATPLLKFRRLFVDKQLTDTIVTIINAHFAAKELFLRRGTAVTATITEAPLSTANEKGERDPEMRHPKKGNEWHFGLKAHTSVDAKSRLVRTTVGAAANVADVTLAQVPLHGDEEDAFGDGEYQSVDKREEKIGAPVNWHVAMGPGKRRALAVHGWAQKPEWIEQIQAIIRAKVEYPCRFMKKADDRYRPRPREWAISGVSYKTPGAWALRALPDLPLLHARALRINK
jgi:IS5 family transposase